MRRLLLVGVVWLAGASSAFAIDREIAFSDPALNQRYLSLIHEIRCPKCLNETIADSDAPVAADLRREVRRLIGDGKSDDEVKDFLSARYGDFVLYRPRVNQTTLALWAGPFVFLVIGGVVFWRIIRSRLGQPLEDEESEA
ncbi:MAG: cytochrome c-type biogenesis protein [Gammaproteobacteria bacterium]